jgi:LacI family transcriptional regulator
MPNYRSTIADVARKAGVSIATVSRVINGTAPVDGETANRVRSAVELLSYFPHAAARTLANRRTDTLGLLLPEISGAFFQPLIRGVETSVSEAGFDLLIHTTRSRPERTIHRPLGEHNTDGLLVFTESLNDKELTRLYNIGFPIVLLHQSSPITLNIPVITIENLSGAQKVVNHLIEVHNCHRIVFLKGPPGQEDSNLREEGYRFALESHGLVPDPSLIVQGEFDRLVAQKTVEQLISGNIPFDSIFTGDDESAIGVLLALREAGKKIPEDIAVVGFDDSQFAQALSPPLTTVHAPTEEVGKQAVLQLVRIIKGLTVEPCLVLPTEIKIRQSCGCNASR